MKRTLYTVVFLCILLALVALPGLAQGTPPLPHAFRGAVTVGGQPAPVGTKIEAQGD